MEFHNKLAFVLLYSLHNGILNQSREILYVKCISILGVLICSLMCIFAL